MKKINCGHKTVLLFVTLLLTFIFAATAYAHGVVIIYTLKADGVVELFAEFDTGEPMAEAQVTIYAPDDPLTPWLTDTADAEGRYRFVIDPELLGTWDVQYRKAGHGDIIHFQLEPGMIDAALVTHPPGKFTSATAPPNPEKKPANTGTSVEPSSVSSGGNTAASGGFSSIQIILMSASVIWGFVGTALYFSSKKTTKDHSHAHGHHH